ncbi:MAG: hypothetical protein JEZ00_05500 [Anaerolineaceae bacterium]|nr:hypothetical protein [Anaerolineaceae bacterium]
MHKRQQYLALFLIAAVIMLSCSSLPFHLGDGGNGNAEITINNAPVEENQTVEIEAPAEIIQPTPDGNLICNNIFYPLVQNNQWIYEYESEGETSQMGLSISELDTGDIAINMLSMDSGLITQTKIDCEDTAIMNFPLLTLNLLMGDYVDGSIEIERSSGLFMPNEAAFTNSNWATDWSGEYTAKGEIFVSYEDDDLKILLDDSPVRLHWAVPEEGQTTYETITVKAGTFNDVIRMHRTVEVDATVNMASDGNTLLVNGTIILEQTLWYKAQVGLIKQQINEANIKVFGIEYPVFLGGTVELIEFKE